MTLSSSQKIDFVPSEILKELRKEFEDLAQDDMKEDIESFFDNCEIGQEDGRYILFHKSTKREIEITSNHIQNFMILAPLIYHDEQQKEKYKIALNDLPRGQQRNIMIDLASYLIENSYADDISDPLRLSSKLEYELIRISNSEKEEIRSNIFISCHEIIISEEFVNKLLGLISA